MPVDDDVGEPSVKHALERGRAAGRWTRTVLWYCDYYTGIEDTDRTLRGARKQRGKELADGRGGAWVEDFLRHWHRRPLGRAGIETPAMQGGCEGMVM